MFNKNLPSPTIPSITGFAINSRAVIGVFLVLQALILSPCPADAPAPPAKDGAATPSPKPKRPPIPAFQAYEGKEGLPNVLLLGDSISIGYTLPVRAALEGKANVYRARANCQHTAVGIEKLDGWLGDRKWDVIHFNWGLHDVKSLNKDMKLDNAGEIVTPLDQYEKNIETLVERLKKTGAVLIFATTTPVPQGATGRKSEDVPKYNAAALRVMEKHGVAVNDLYKFVLPRHAEIQKQEGQPGNVHFTDEGSQLLAGQVVSHIETALKKPRKSTQASGEDQPATSVP